MQTRTKKTPSSARYRRGDDDEDKGMQRRQQQQEEGPRRRGGNDDDDGGGWKKAATTLAALGVSIAPGQQRRRSLRDVLRNGEAAAAFRDNPKAMAAAVSVAAVQHLARVADLGLLFSDMNDDRLVFCTAEEDDDKEVLRLDLQGREGVPAARLLPAARPADESWQSFEARRLMLLALPLALLLVHVHLAPVANKEANELRPFATELEQRLHAALATFRVPLDLDGKSFRDLAEAAGQSLEHESIIAKTEKSPGRYLVEDVLVQLCRLRFLPPTAAAAEAGSSGGSSDGSTVGSALGYVYDGSLQGPRLEPAYLGLEALQWSPPAPSAAKLLELVLPPRSAGLFVTTTTLGGEGSSNSSSISSNSSSLLGDLRRRWKEDTQLLARQAAALEAMCDLRTSLSDGNETVAEWLEKDMSSAEEFLQGALPPLVLRGLCPPCR
jgi:hypothetical protein